MLKIMSAMRQSLLASALDHSPCALSKSYTNSHHGKYWLAELVHAVLPSQEPIIDRFLQSLDVHSAVGAVKALEGIEKEAICTLLITKTLEKTGLSVVLAGKS